MVRIRSILVLAVSSFIGTAFAQESEVRKIFKDMSIHTTSISSTNCTPLTFKLLERDFKAAVDNRNSHQIAVAAELNANRYAYCAVFDLTASTDRIASIERDTGTPPVHLNIPDWAYMVGNALSVAAIESERFGMPLSPHKKARAKKLLEFASANGKDVSYLLLKLEKNKR